MQKLAPWLVRLVGLWILAGGLGKLLNGTPAILPGPIRDLAFGMEWNFRIAIVVEIAVGVGALLTPKRFWAPVTAVMLVFLGVLGAVIAAGEESCGCFGAEFPIPPLGMLAIDGALLLAMLAARPWRIESDPKRPIGFVWLAAAVAGAIAPFAKFGLPASASSGVVDVAADGDAPTTTAAATTTAPPAKPEGPWQAPPKDQWPHWVDTSNFPSWVGQPLWRTPIGTWVDTTGFPDDVTVILWRKSCDHCAEELRKLARDPDPGPLALVRLADDAGMPAVVEQKPSVPKQLDRVTPTGLTWMFSTPVVVEVEGGVVTSIEEHTE